MATGWTTEVAAAYGGQGQSLITNRLRKDSYEYNLPYILDVAGLAAITALTT
jgi:hypothetical protein